MRFEFHFTKKNTESSAEENEKTAATTVPDSIRLEQDLKSNDDISDPGLLSGKEIWYLYLKNN